MNPIATGAAHFANLGRLSTVVAANSAKDTACAQSVTAAGHNHGSLRKARVRSLSVLTSSVMSKGYHCTVMITIKTARMA